MSAIRVPRPRPLLNRGHASVSLLWIRVQVTRTTLADCPETNVRRTRIRDLLLTEWILASSNFLQTPGCVRLPFVRRQLIVRQETKRVLAALLDSSQRAYSGSLTCPGSHRA